MKSAGRDCATCSVRGADCFCSLTTESLVDLQAIGHSMRFEAGESVLRQGYPGDRVYVMCSGRVKLTASSKSRRQGERTGFVGRLCSCVGSPHVGKVEHVGIEALMYGEHDKRGTAGAGSVARARNMAVAVQTR